MSQCYEPHHLWIMEGRKEGRKVGKKAGRQATPADVLSVLGTPYSTPRNIALVFAWWQGRLSALRSSERSAQGSSTTSIISTSWLFEEHLIHKPGISHNRAFAQKGWRKVSRSPWGVLRQHSADRCHPPGCSRQPESDHAPVVRRCVLEPRAKQECRCLPWFPMTHWGLGDSCPYNSELYRISCSGP